MAADKADDATDLSCACLAVVDTEDGVSQLGSLRVSFEGVQTLRAILEESDGDPSVAPPSSSSSR